MWCSSLAVAGSFQLTSLPTYSKSQLIIICIKTIAEILNTRKNVSRLQMQICTFVPCHDCEDWLHLLNSWTESILPSRFLSRSHFFHRIALEIIKLLCFRVIENSTLLRESSFVSVELHISYTYEFISSLTRSTHDKISYKIHSSLISFKHHTQYTPSRVRYDSSKSILFWCVGLFTFSF